MKGFGSTITNTRKEKKNMKKEVKEDGWIRRRSVASTSSGSKKE